MCYVIVQSFEKLLVAWIIYNEKKNNFILFKEIFCKINRFSLGVKIHRNYSAKPYVFHKGILHYEKFSVFFSEGR